MSYKHSLKDGAAWKLFLYEHFDVKVKAFSIYLMEKLSTPHQRSCNLNGVYPPLTTSLTLKTTTLPNTTIKNSRGHLKKVKHSKKCKIFSTKLPN